MDTNAMFSRIWAVYEDGGFLAMCAWCRRVRIDEEWLFAPHAALVAIDEPGVISHSICEQCAESFDPALAGRLYSGAGSQ